LLALADVAVLSSGIVARVGLQSFAGGLGICCFVGTMPLDPVSSSWPPLRIADEDRPTLPVYQVAFLIAWGPR
jgi:hypothetical protein